MTPGTDPITELLDRTLQLRSDLRLFVQGTGPRKTIVIEDPVKSKFYRVGEAEYHFLNALDGKRTIGQSLKLLASHRIEITPADAFQICSWLGNNDLVQTGNSSNVERFLKSNAAKKKQKISKFCNPFFLKVPLVNPDRFLNSLVGTFGFVFSKTGLVIWLLVVGFAMHLAVENWDRLSAASMGIFSGYRWLWMAIAWIGLKLIHEMGHGLCCRKYGGYAKESGVVFMCLMPLAYIDVTSSWRFEKKSHRIFVSLAGMFVEIFVAAVAIILWMNLENGILSDLCYNIALMASLTTILFNANPLMRFDGYFVLSDLVGVPNLYTRGQKSLSAALAGCFFEKPEKQLRESGSKESFILAYGIGAFFWRILICVGLAILASSLFYGAGLLIAALGVVLWVSKPILKLVSTIKNNHEKIIWRRAAVSLSVILVLTGWATWYLFAPAMIHSPGYVEYTDMEVIRAESSGFLKNIYVQSGDSVKKGDLLFELNNEELQLKLDSLSMDLKQSKIKAQNFRRERLYSEAESELQKLRQLEGELKELEQQLSKLSIRANMDGELVRRGLSELKGTYIREGDEIAVVGNSSKKEIRVSVEQSDAVGLAQNAIMTRVRFTGQGSFEAPLINTDPQATRNPIHPSLTSPYGGPLVVQQASSEDAKEKYELMRPHFKATIDLSEKDSLSITAGRRATISFRSPEKLLGQQVYEVCRDWLKAKYDAVMAEPASGY